MNLKTENRLNAFMNTETNLNKHKEPAANMRL